MPITAPTPEPGNAPEGILEPITEADFDTVPLSELAALAGRYITQELTPAAVPEPTPAPEAPAV